MERLYGYEVTMCDDETDKVKLAKLILRITGIDSAMNTIISHCQSDAYGDEFGDFGFEYAERSGSIQFLHDDGLYGPYGYLTDQEYILCKKYYDGGVDSLAFYEFRNGGILWVKFILHIESAVRKGFFYNIFAQISLKNCDNWQDYQVDAYTQPIFGAEDDVSPTLFWMLLKQ